MNDTAAIRGSSATARIEYLIDELTKHQDKMTSWEGNFLISVEEQFTRYGRLADKQVEKLEEIHKGLAK